VSRHVIAIGRSPVCDLCVIRPRNAKVPTIEKIKAVVPAHEQADPGAVRADE
jgi:hypothetical protein